MKEIFRNSHTSIDNNSIKINSEITETKNLLGRLSNLLNDNLKYGSDFIKQSKSIGNDIEFVQNVLDKLESDIESILVDLIEIEKNL